MPPPIRCPSCHREFNATFPACPFCKQQVRVVFQSSTQRCGQCRREFNKAMTECPFCKAPARGSHAASAPLPRASSDASAAHREGGVVGERDYAKFADETANRPGTPLRLDFSPASVLALDVFITETWGPEGASPQTEGWTPPEGKWNVIVSFGVYFGEVMRRAFGGRWGEDPQAPGDPIRAFVSLANGTQVFPVAKVYKRFKNGVEDSLEPLFDMVRSHVGAPSDPMREIDAWLEQARFFAGVRRHDHALKFLVRASALRVTEEKLQEIERLTNEAERAEQSREQAEREAQAREADRALESAATTMRAVWEPLAAECAALCIRLDGSPASLGALDVVLDRKLAQSSAEDVARLGGQVGAYVGEVLATRCSATWRYGATPTASVLSWPNGTRFSPFSMVDVRVKRGPNAGVFQQLEILRTHLREREGLAAVDGVREAREWIAVARALVEGPIRRIDLGAVLARRASTLDPSNVEAHVVYGQWASRATNGASEAQAAFDRALALDPKNAAALTGKAALAFANGDVDAAHKLVEAAVAADGRDASARALRGSLRVSRGDLDGGAADLRASAELDANVAATWLALGTVEQARGAMEAAERAWARALAADETCFAALHALAQAAESTGKSLEAAKHYERLVAQCRDPAIVADARARLEALANDPELVRAQATELAAQGRTADAVARYEILSRLLPTDPEGWREQGVGKAMLGDLAAALVAFSRANDVAPSDAMSWDHHAVALGRANRFAEGLAVLDRGIAKNPGAASLWARRAFFLSRLSRWQDAKTSARRATSLDPASYTGWLFLADAEQKLGNVEGAIAAFRSALAHVPSGGWQRALEVRRMLHALEHPDVRLDPAAAQELESRALDAAQRGQASEAQVLFEQACARDPYQPQIWHNRAALAAATERHEEALAHYHQALMLDPAFLPSVQGRAAGLALLDRRDEAIAVLDAAIALLPRTADLLVQRARLLVAMSQYAAAVEGYTRAEQVRELDAEGLRWFAHALSQVGRKGDALDAYDRAMRKSSDKSLWVEKAMVLRELGRDEEAHALESAAYRDEAFAEQLHQEDLALLAMLRGERAPS